jgi:hypothetical protein
MKNHGRWNRMFLKKPPFLFVVYIGGRNCATNSRIKDDRVVARTMRGRMGSDDGGMRLAFRHRVMARWRKEVCCFAPKSDFFVDLSF